jgi:hypothetical protein
MKNRNNLKAKCVSILGSLLIAPIVVGNLIQIKIFEMPMSSQGPVFSQEHEFPKEVLQMTGFAGGISKMVDDRFEMALCCVGLNKMETEEGDSEERIAMVFPMASARLTPPIYDASNFYKGLRDKKSNNRFLFLLSSDQFVMEDGKAKIPAAKGGYNHSLSELLIDYIQGVTAESCVAFSSSDQAEIISQDSQNDPTVLRNSSLSLASSSSASSSEKKLNSLSALKSAASALKDVVKFDAMQFSPSARMTVVFRNDAAAYPHFNFVSERLNSKQYRSVLIADPNFEKSKIRFVAMSIDNQVWHHLQSELILARCDEYLKKAGMSPEDLIQIQ